MSALNIKVNSSELIAQRNRLLEEDLARATERYNLLREELKESKERERVHGPKKDLCELRKRRKYLEEKINREKTLKKRMDSRDNCDAFSCAKKSQLMAYLGNLQVIKIQLAELELAGVVRDIWDCKTEGKKEALQPLVECINQELDDCPDTLDPRVVDIIREVTKDL